MSIIITIIALSFVVVIHELGHFLVAKWSGVRVEEFGIGFPPRMFGRKIGETMYSINLFPFGGFVKIAGENAEEDKKSIPDEESFEKKPAWKKIGILMAGVVMNILLGWVIITGVFMVGVPQEVFVNEVQKDSPAFQAEILSGDKIKELQIGEQKLVPKESEEVVNFVRENRGKEVALTIERGSERIEKKLQSRTNVDEGPLGVLLVDVGIPKQSFLTSLQSGVEETGVILYEIVRGFVTLIKGVADGSVSGENVTGPIGIFKIAMSMSGLGLVYLLHFIALISFNLAILNSIPFPALDGGRVLIVAIEKVIGKAIPGKVQQIVNGTGFALLILLTLFVTVKDISRWF